MSNDTHVQPIRVAVLLYRHSARNVPEYLLVQDGASPNRSWQVLDGPVADDVTPHDAAQYLVERVAGLATHGSIAPADYRCPLPLWGSPEAAETTSTGDFEEAYMAEIRAQDGEPHFHSTLYGTFRWVTVIDAVSMLRYPEHVEALLRVSSKLDAVR